MAAMKVALSLRLIASSLALSAGLAQPVLAQRGEVRVPGGVMPAGTVQPPSASDVLASNLRILAANPRDVYALTQAGNSALAVGDPNAALGFFARAEQLQPTNGRVKAGLASAMVMMERPADAMPLFVQAQGFGIAERDFAKDRGLAHDLMGDPRSAQRDYALALRSSNDPETVRRYALSLGISGDRDQALRLLEPLLRQQDQAAWRARAFVLAMTGDQKGAERIVQQVMPGGTGTAMTGFLRQLAGLNPSARAHAVNFGTLPSSGYASASYAALEPSDGLRAIPGSMTDSLTREEVAQPSFVADAERSGKKSNKAKRRRPGRDDGELAAAPARVEAAARSGLPERIRPVAMSDVRAQPSSPPPSPAPAAVTRPTAQIVTRTASPPVTAESPQAPVFEISADRPALTRAAPVSTPAPAPPPVRVAVTPPPPPPPAPVLAPVVSPPPVQLAVVTPPPVVTPAPVIAPPPAAVVAAVAAPAPAPVEPVRVTAPAAETPKPSFSPAVMPPSLSAPAPAPVVPATVAPAPVAVAAAPVVTPAPAPIASPVVASSTGVMGPPVPEGLVNAAVPAERPVSPAPAAAVAASEVLADPAEEKGLGGLLDAIQPEEEQAAAVAVGEENFRRARLAAKRKAELEAKAKVDAELKAKTDAEAKAKKAEDDAKKAEARKHPERVWVQVATGSAKSGIGITVKRVREQAGDALKGAGAASLPYKATNRILMGPYASEAEARRVVNALAKKGVQATTFTSSSGQEVAKLSSK